MKKILLFFSLVFLASFVFACDGCTYGSSCYDYGEIALIGAIYHYCDFDSSVMTQQKPDSVGNVACLNDFECKEGYSCLDGECTNAYNYFLQGYNELLANLSGICSDSNWFCSNSTSITNATALTNKNCSFAGPNSVCYMCNSPFYYNSSIGKCISGVCSSPSRCLNVSSVVNASVGSDYCPDDKKCFACDPSSDFEWNGEVDQCKMKNCTSTPGCLNQTNITNGQLVSNRLCETGSCWTCKYCYTWNSSSSSCVYSPTCSTAGVVWTDVVFTSAELSSGAYKLLSVHDRVNFSFESRSYRLEILSIENDRLIFNLYPISNNYNLFSGNDAKFDLNGDASRDLQISLAGVVSGKANVSIEYLEASPGHSDDPTDPTDSGNPTDSTDYDGSANPTDSTDPIGLNSGVFTQQNLWWLVLIGVVIIALLAWLIVYLINKKPKNNGSTNSQVGQQQPPVAPANGYGSYPVGGYRPPVQQMPQQNVQRRI